MCRGLLSLTDSEEYSACIQADDESSKCKQLDACTGSEHWKAAAADNTAGKEQCKQTTADNRGFHSKAHAHAAAAKAARYVWNAQVHVRMHACMHQARGDFLALNTIPVVQQIHQICCTHAAALLKQGSVSVGSNQYQRQPEQTCDGN